MKEKKMASLAEALKAAKAGKRVTNKYREEVFCKKGSLRWSNDYPVEVWNETLEGWIIEEPVCETTQNEGEPDGVTS
jgi:hypothetical protein